MSDPDTTGRIIAAAIKIHRKLGPGLLESAYEACLAYELEHAGLPVQRQKAVPLVYNAVKLECGFRANLLVDNEVVVGIKCKEAIHPVDHAQLLSHLRLLDLRVGLLINFHVLMLKDGIKRMVNKLSRHALGLYVRRGKPLSLRPRERPQRTRRKTGRDAE